MNKNLKKIMISGATLLMLATAGTGLAITQNANASSKSVQITKLERQKKYYSSKLTGINQALVKLEHSNKRTHRVRHNRHLHKTTRRRANRKSIHVHKVTRQSNKMNTPTATWYIKNRKNINKRYLNKSTKTGKTYTLGYNDPNASSAAYSYIPLHVNYMNNNQYRNGWVYGFAEKSTGYEPNTKAAFNEAIQTYNTGKAFANKNKKANLVYYQYTKWVTKSGLLK